LHGKKRGSSEEKEALKIGCSGVGTKTSVSYGYFNI